MAQGFTQQSGLDYKDTFSPVIKAMTIRTILAIATKKSWLIYQLDVSNAFLHGNLSETIFMAQPPAFVDTSHLDYVCKLHKSLYGLKQAPRAWFQRLSTYLLSLKFVASKSDHSLFIYKQGVNIAFILVYVDDLVVTGSCLQFVHDIIWQLK